MICIPLLISIFLNLAFLQPLFYIKLITRSLMIPALSCYGEPQFSAVENQSAVFMQIFEKINEIQLTKVNRD